MFTRLFRPIITRSGIELPAVIRKNNYSSVPLAFSKYHKKDQQGRSEANLVVIHGLFGSKSNWNSLCKAFAVKTNREIYSVDARNHGDSEHTENHTYELMAEDIREFIEDKNLVKCSLLGHSMGGRAVMYCALKYPHLVEKLIVVDISPVGKIGTTQSDIPLFIHAMKSIDVPDKYTIHQARVVADEALSKIINEKSLRDFLITNLVKMDNGSFKWRINLDTLEKCFQEGVSRFPNVQGMHFDGPTLFIGGSKSDYLRLSDKPQIQKLFPNLSMEFLDAGHWVHAEKSEDFVRLVVDFLNK